ncbi:hypothetical protein LA080_002925 [Diaporthe eres]|nr:hypothetical protein LA080_002925 [Diaporthe eres]
MFGREMITYQQPVLRREACTELRRSSQRSGGARSAPVAPRNGEISQSETVHSPVVRPGGRFGRNSIVVWRKARPSQVQDPVAGSSALWSKSSRSDPPFQHYVVHQRGDLQCPRTAALYESASAASVAAGQMHNIVGHHNSIAVT